MSQRRRRKVPALHDVLEVESPRSPNATSEYYLHCALLSPTTPTKNKLSPGPLRQPWGAPVTSAWTECLRPSSSCSELDSGLRHRVDAWSSPLAHGMAQRRHISSDLWGLGDASAPSRPVRSGKTPLGLLANTHSFPSASSLPELRRVPRGARKKVHPSSQNFSELTGGMSVTDRVRWIPLEEHRGIMVKQLDLLVDHIRVSRNTKSDAVLGWFDAAGEQIRFKTISLYEIKRWVIKPLTQPANCSYVEAVTNHVEAQMPSWFACHWWGEPFVDFAVSIGGHAKTRGADLCGVTGAYWVYAFSHNHASNPESPEFKEPIEDMGFYKAMCVCKGMVMVLDRAGPSGVFKRAWCCLELSTAVNLQHLMIDFVAVDAGGECRVLTEGLTAEEFRIEDGGWLGPSGWVNKVRREDKFPIRMLHDALKIKTSETQASVELDRDRILACLAGRDARSSPEPRKAIERAMDELDRRLRARLGRVLVRQAIQQQEDTSSGYYFQAAAEAVSHDPDLQALSLNLAGCWKTKDNDLGPLARSIPDTGTLKHLSFSFRDCYQMCSVGKLLDKVAQADTVQHMQFDFSKCMGLSTMAIEEFVAFARNLKDRDSHSRKGMVRSLMLDLTGCENVGCIGEMVEAFKAVGIADLAIISPDGTNVAAEVPKVKPRAKPKPKPKAKKQWKSVTAQMAWAGSKVAQAVSRKTRD